MVVQVNINPCFTGNERIFIKVKSGYVKIVSGISGVFA
jgi:hypothetical protein